MNITIKIERNSETYQVQTNLMVIVLWERRYKKRASDLSLGVAMEDLSYMAYEASKMAGVTVPVSLDEFIRSITSLEIVENEPANPTEPAPTDGN